jgi:aspartyl-tRNA(Asn)/glutamyl-tRNA(Gln) amidotransferase subunit A
MTALHEWPATALAAAYRAGTLSPHEVVRALVDHIARWEPTLHALWDFDPAPALAAARAAEQRFVRGQPLSELDGVPVTIKENIATRGTALPLGTAATELVPATADAPPAARLREAGAVLLAKTTMPDYGMLSSGLSSFHAQQGRLTRNPWEPLCNPGGSSAGAGAAAAAAYAPLHLGTDIGGSIRLPAAWCGVFGFKPSLGRVPIHPPYTGRAAGPLARHVGDAALAMRVLSQPDARDTMSLPPQALDWTALDKVDLRGLRLGLWLAAGWGLACEPDTLAAVQAAAQRFAAAGAQVELLPAFATPAMYEGVDRFWRLRSWLDLQALPVARRELVLPYIRAWAAGAAGIDAAQGFHAHAQMAALRDATVAATLPFDAVLSPVSPVGCFPAEWAGPTNDPARAMHHIAFTVPFSMSEQPACSVPCGVDARGLPIGLQIAARRHDDLMVLRLARAWEQLRAPLPPWPSPPVASVPSPG